MYKVFAFLKRNPNLTHDEYRAGHVGYHCCFSRRLKNIRGYLVNIYANESLKSKLPNLYDEITRGEPAGFLDHWDGFPEVYFDDRQSWTQAATKEPTRALAEGLVEDPDWNLADGPYLFEPVPDTDGEFYSHHLRVEEHIIVPVERGEYKQTKLIAFFKRAEDMPEAQFHQQLIGDYAERLSRLEGLEGCIINVRDEDQEAAMRGFFPDNAWSFSAAGTKRRRQFCNLWDGAIELHFPSPASFAAARSKRPDLVDLEQSLFSAIWYVEVDENLIVLPNRDPAPDFYFR